MLEVERAEHLVGDDGVEDCLPLARVEVECTRLAGILAEPPVQQLGRGRRDHLVQVGGAGFQIQAELLGALGQRLGEDQGISGAHGVGSATVVTTSASKPNTSTTRTQMRRSPALRGMVKAARSTTLSASPSFAVFPR